MVCSQPYLSGIIVSEAVLHNCGTCENFESGHCVGMGKSVCLLIPPLLPLPHVLIHKGMLFTCIDVLFIYIYISTILNEF